MKTDRGPFKSLSQYVDYLQARGTYVFSQKQAISDLGSSAATIRVAANRLINEEIEVDL